MPKLLFVTNALYSHYLPFKEIALRFPEAEITFLLINGYKEDEKKIKEDISKNGWEILASGSLRPKSSSVKKDSLDDTFKPRFSVVSSQVSQLINRLNVTTADLVFVESYSLVAATAAQISGKAIVVLNIFCMQPRVSYNKNILETPKNILVSNIEMLHVNSYRLLHKLKPVTWKGFESKVANLFPCPPGYSNLYRTPKRTHFFIGSLSRTP
jgi:hypothetical protein